MCSSASEAVRGCEEEGCEEEGYEEEGSDEGRRMERERERVTKDRDGDSVSFVWRLCRGQPHLFRSVVMTFFIQHVIRYNRRNSRVAYSSASLVSKSHLNRNTSERIFDSALIHENVTP